MSSQPPIRRVPADRPGVGLAWLGAMAAIVALFVGGSGLLFIMAGHLAPATVTLVGIGTAGGLYLAWFFGPGPGADRSPSPAQPMRHVGHRPILEEDRWCSYCGRMVPGGTTVLWGFQATICAACIDELGRRIQDASR